MKFTYMVSPSDGKVDIPESNIVVNIDPILALHP